MKGIILFGFPSEEVEMIKSWLSGSNVKVVCGQPALQRTSSVLDAMRLLSSEGTFDYSLDENFVCFSRVVLFCGLRGEVMEGLVEIWDKGLSTCFASCFPFSSRCVYMI